MVSRAALAAFGILVAGTASAQDPAAPAKRERIRELALAGIEANFAGRWDEAETTFARIRALDPTDPAGAFYPVTTLYWRSALDPRDPANEARIRAGLERTVALAEARTERDERDADAWFLGGQALVNLGQFLGERGEIWDGVSHAQKGARWLERALEIEPADVDPYLTLGAYRYFMSQLPDLLKWFDWLWFIPKGDRDGGLRMLDECARRCRLSRLGAEVMLMQIWAVFERDYDRALAAAVAMRDRFPDNAVHHVRYARLLLFLQRYDDLIAETLKIQEKVRAGVPTYDAAVDALAVLGRARAHLDRGRVDAAAEALAAFGPDEPRAPAWVRAQALLARGQLADARGRRDEAVGLYREVVAMDLGDRDEGAGAQAKRHLEAPWRPPRREPPPVVRELERKRP